MARPPQEIRIEGVKVELVDFILHFQKSELNKLSDIAMEQKSFIRIVPAVLAGMITVAAATNDCQCVAAQPTPRTRVLVDTVLALNTMQVRATDINNICNSRIGDLQNAISENERQLKQFRDSLAELEYLISSYAPKVNDKSLINKTATFIKLHFGKFPAEELIKQCSEMDLRKYKEEKLSDEDIAKLREKRQKQLLKRVGNGDFTDPLLTDILSYRQAMLLNELNGRTAKIDAWNKDIDSLKKQIIPVPTSFNKTTFKKILNTDIYPTKTITEYIDDPNYVPYEVLMERYYSDLPVENIPSITGRFNGMIEDRITVFPLESSRTVNPDFSFSESEIVLYKKLILVSEKGSVNEHILTQDENKREFEFIVGHGLDINIKALNETWKPEEEPYTGFYISIHPIEYTSTYNYTYAYENGDFEIKAPLNPKYMTFDECIRLMMEQNHEGTLKTFNYNDPNWEHDNHTVKYIIVHPAQIGVPMEFAKDANWYVKTDPPVQTLEIESKNLAASYVMKNYFGTGNDGLAFIYDTTGKQDDSVMEIYCYRGDSDNSLTIEELNDVDIDATHEWFKREIVKIDKNGDRSVTRIPFPDEYDVEMVEE